ncbi:hypothetical protein CLAIMM_15037 isoform 4 [Cladophialophora immunda]|nr:hypothetical protein CLAIMM_15037 isoform 1 [Cladophialophora immunda]OQV11155.1 hypothetical protein CLAIMM_15037 isoform 2 [Cladophialophora immunda]OQV11156.1 hypothetical protein CLAIMM_15037 isoform 3 [Cladophialophora immunda]OQV11157.1 hypothetical protein CLAIMM_15037 isoform 4 [Cladophialophora immunda]
MDPPPIVGEDLVPVHQKCLPCIVFNRPCDDSTWRCEECQGPSPQASISEQLAATSLVDGNMPRLLFKCLGQDHGLEGPLDLHFDMTWLDRIITEGKDGVDEAAKLRPFQIGAMSYFPDDDEIKTALRWFTSHQLRFGAPHNLRFPNVCPLLHKQALRDLAARHGANRITLEDWWKTFLMSGLVLSSWIEAATSQDVEPTQLNDAVEEVIALFRRKTRQLHDNLDAIKPDAKTLGSMKATVGVMEDAAAIGSSTHLYPWSLIVACMSGGLHIFLRFGVTSA